MKQSLGLLEVSGLALAISCADVMAKAASITLLGMEKTNGSGWTVIKVAGDVASVQPSSLAPTLRKRVTGWWHKRSLRGLLRGFWPLRQRVQPSLKRRLCR